MSIRQRASARVIGCLLSIAAAGVIPGLALAQNAAPAYLQIRSVPHGKVETYAYKSKSLGTDRKIIVYTPPDYEGLRIAIQSFTCSTGRAVQKQRGPSAGTRT